MSWVTDYFAESERKRAEELANAEKEAKERGKELFDLQKFEQLLNRGPQAKREREHRVNYYIFNSEMMTLAEYAALLIKGEPWEDSR